MLTPLNRRSLNALCGSVSGYSDNDYFKKNKKNENSIIVNFYFFLFFAAAVFCALRINAKYARHFLQDIPCVFFWLCRLVPIATEVE